MESDRDAPAPVRRGPSGRSVAAKSASSRRAPASTAAASLTVEVIEPEVEVIEPEAEVVDVAPAVVEPDVVEAPAPEPEAPVAGDAPGTDDAPVTDDQTSSPVPVIRPARVPKAARPARAPKKAGATASDVALSVRGLTKRFGGIAAVDSVDLEIRAGTFAGFVGPNGAGKTTTLAMITGLLRPDAGTVKVHGADIWRNPAVAKRALGVLPDQLRLFDRLTGAEYLHHAGALRGIDRETTAHRVDDLSAAFGFRHSLDRFVSDYSAGMVKKIAIAAAMIHSPRLLVLDEPFESVDPVSANVVIGILKRYAAAGGTVLLSSHSMGLIERTCDTVAIIAEGRMLASGPLDAVLDGESLETRFVELAGGATAVEGMEWLQSYSD